MWFKNLQVYRLATSFQVAPGALEEQLAKHPLIPCSGMAMSSRGWVSPRDNGQVVYGQGKQMLIALGVEQKLLPASVINQATKERAEKMEQQQGYVPGRKQLRDIKERITAELLPRAFARRRVTRAWLDPVNGWLVVDAASPTKADEFTEALRDAVGELPVTLLDTQQSPGAAMTSWLAGGSAPGSFEIDQECELCGASEEKATVRYVRHPLDGKEVKQHITSGKFVTKLALTWNNRASFVLGEQMQLRKLRFVGVEKNGDEGGKSNADELYDADFALMTGTLAEMLTELVQVLGGETELAKAA